MACSQTMTTTMAVQTVMDRSDCIVLRFLYCFTSSSRERPSVTFASFRASQNYYCCLPYGNNFRQLLEIEGHYRRKLIGLCSFTISCTMDRHSSYPPMTSTVPSTEQISNFLMGAAQRGVARRNSLEAARLSSLGLAHSHRGAQMPRQSVEDQIVFEALMAAGRAVQQPPPALNQHSSSSSPVVPPTKRDDDPDKLVVPSPKAKLPSMENMELRDITEPHDNDVLCGRGGSVNNHKGNEKFRTLVQSFKVKYLLSTKADKFQMSEDVVRAVRSQNPPGRFLQRDENNGKWFDIGDRAREKVSRSYVSLANILNGIKSQCFSPFLGRTSTQGRSSGYS